MSLNNPRPHHGFVPEYQASGVPFVSSSHDLTDTSVVKFSFPYVSRHMTIYNSGSAAIRVGFTENGVNSNPDANYFVVTGNNQSPRLELKCDSVFVRKDEGTSANKISVVAGITNIARDQFFAMTGSNDVAGVG